MRFQTAGIALVALATARCGPTVISANNPPTNSPESAITWTLPRTEVKVEGGFQLVSCKNLPGGKLDLEVKVVSATATEVPIPDPATTRRIPIPELQDWLANNTYDVSSYDSGIVKSIAVKVQDQTGPILVGVFKIAATLAALAPALPPSALPEPSGRCGAASTQAQKLASLPQGRQQISGADATKVAGLKSLLTLTRSETLNPGGKAPVLQEGPLTDAAHPALPTIGIEPSVDEMVAAGWIQPGASNLLLPAIYVSTVRDATRLEDGTQVPTSPAVDEQFLDGTFHYRDPALIWVVLRDDQHKELNRKQMAFGQFGVPKRIPTVAGIFETWDTKFLFAEDGRLQEASASTTARGAVLVDVGNQAATTATGFASASEKDSEVNAKINSNKQQSDLYGGYSDCLKSGSPNCKSP